MSENNFIPTQQELDENLKYEIDMLKNTCCAWTNKKNNLNQFGINCLVESLALHARVLIFFFYGNKKKYPDDIIAQDFLSENIKWAEIRPEMSDFLKEVKFKADKQLAHLCLGRIQLSREDRHGWNFQKVYQELNEIIELFYRTLEESKK